ncbi:hypothetical protein CAB17_01405 [Legionella sainthelensi]|uniref:Uncharacterized protein n=1 Tax=Legionella sainthelensi TaxID=28087 RepID=A0A2H5FH31_9GAMM|nr:hypothetical protein CAB17_01405 [Legionella sainthelensi]
MRVFLLVLFKVRTSIKTGNSHFFKFLCQIKSKLIHLINWHLKFLSQKYLSDIPSFLAYFPGY